ncbi:uncharacterized protein LOC123537134 [Mercenaria mercenaria]|uniref:uncharacterized protein LOC123537134 n=1 Tax=Mercenaria mercenaria TaxID=6596 RepID=UPI00234EAE3D|nr:uncharacterized protein LOC123537134 [Mercenaria mercenaria]
MEDATNRRREAHRLLNMRILPDQSELESACCAFGRRSEICLTICDTISEYIKTQSTEIADVWAAYKCIDYKKNNKINIVFVVITRNSNVGVNINHYNIYERNTKVYNEESRIVLAEVENGQQNDDKFTEEEVEALENCISENADTLMDNHKNLNIISPSMKKSIAFGTKDAMIHDKLCIALYVHIKGLIPVAELPFPSDICGYPTDVLEDGFTQFGGGPLDFHQKLKMGLAIHANVKNNNGELLVGTLEGFLDHPSFGLCGLTCAHVVVSGDEMEKIKNLGCISLMENDKQVFQPVDHRALSFGRVVSAVYTEGGNGRIGMEVALFEIFDRHPVDGSFPTSKNYRDIGFDDSNPMVFGTGKVCKRSNIRKRSEVYKYGISTEVTRGSLGLLGSVVRTTEMSGRSEALEYRLHNQIPVLRIDGKDFALPGDSGALVFFDDNFGDSVAIGVVEGGQNNGIVFVTPLYDILSALDCPPTMKRFIPLNSVSTDSGMFMECDDTEYMDM